MLIAPGFVPEGGGIDWGNVTASSLLGLDPGATVVEGQVHLPLSLGHKSRQNRKESFSLNQIVPGDARAVWRSHPPGGEESTAWRQVTLGFSECFASIPTICHRHPWKCTAMQITGSPVAGW